MVAVVDLSTYEVKFQFEEPNYSFGYSLSVPLLAPGDAGWLEDDASVRPWLVGAAFDRGRTLKIWELGGGGLTTELRFNESPLQEFTILRDGKRILTTYEDGTVRVWQVRTGKPLGIPIAHGWKPYVALLGLDETSFATYDPSIRQISFSSALDGNPVFQPLRSNLDGQWNWHRSLGRSGGVVLASGGGNGANHHEFEVGIWSPGSAGRRMDDVQIQTEAPVNHCVFSHDGVFLLGCITTGEDVPGALRVWDSASLYVVEEYSHPAGVVYAEFSPDGKSILSVCLDGGVRLWAGPVGRSFFSSPRAESSQRRPIEACSNTCATRQGRPEPISATMGRRW